MKKSFDMRFLGRGKSEQTGKPLIFYTQCNHCQEEKIANGDFNRIGQEGDSDG